MWALDVKRLITALVIFRSVTEQSPRGLTVVYYDVCMFEYGLIDVLIYLFDGVVGHQVVNGIRDYCPAIAKISESFSDEPRS